MTSNPASNLDARVVADRLDALAAQLSDSAKRIRDGTISLDTNIAERTKIIRTAKEVVDVAKEQQEQFVDLYMVLVPLTVIRIFIKWKVFENIPVSGTISYSDLAAKVDADRSLIVRLAWNLVTAGILKQVGPDRVSHTSKSKVYMTNNPMSAMICFAFDDMLPGLAAMPKFFDINPRQETTDRLNTIYAFAHGSPGKPVWDVMTRDKERMANFMLAMSVTAGNWPNLGSYNLQWAIDSGNKEDNKDRAVLVDVGGGKGHTIKAILGATPGLEASRCILEDLPEIIGAVKASDDPALAGVRLVGLDFHTEQPVKGALVYYIRRCLHDYGDDECTNMLKRIANAMACDSRLLIVEAILSNPPSTFAAGADLMLATLGGKERTLEGFHDIVAKADLEIMQVCTEPGVEGAVIECARKAA